MKKEKTKNLEKFVEVMLAIMIISILLFAIAIYAKLYVLTFLTLGIAVFALKMACQLNMLKKNEKH